VARFVLSSEGNSPVDISRVVVNIQTQVDHLTKILFTKAHCLCHDINQITKAQNHIDLIMGFSTGEIIWFEPISQKYTRLNKNVS
jgi:hypothetical protein